MLVSEKGVVLYMEGMKALIKENKQQIALFGLIIAALAVILMGILVWKLPVIGVCVFVLLQSGLAICLQDLPVWLHGAVLIAQLLVGLIFGNGMFILVCAVYYVVSILVFSIWDK